MTAGIICILPVCLIQFASSHTDWRAWAQIIQTPLAFLFLVLFGLVRSRRHAELHAAR